MKVFSSIAVVLADPRPVLKENCPFDPKIFEFYLVALKLLTYLKVFVSSGSSS